MTVIYSCPDCDGDLSDDYDGWNLWCDACQRAVPLAFLDPGSGEG